MTGHQGIVAALVGLCSVTMSGQPSTLRFDVTSVKLVQDNRGGLRLTDSEFTMPSATVQTMIAFAYGGPSFRVMDGEDWIRQQRYEIRGTFSPRASNVKLNVRERLEQTKAMVRTLLSERFALRVREERRTQSRFVLRIKDPKRLDAPPRANPACDELRAAILSGDVNPRRSDEPPPPVDTSRPDCSIRQGMRDEMYVVSSDGATMDEFVSLLMVMLGRYVDDQTGIHGSIALKVAFAREQVSYLATQASTAGTTTGPTIADALATDMNLSLRADQGPVPVIVVESVQHPTPN